MKTCTKCGELKTLVEFPSDTSKKDGKHSQCKACHKARNSGYRKDPVKRAELCARSKKWREINPELNKATIRNSTLKKKYGITQEDYIRILESQDYKCAICGSEDTKISWSSNLHVDHNHKTGKVRGLLCQGCNVTLGKMDDSPQLLRKAADYLEESDLSES